MSARRSPNTGWMSEATFQQQVVELAHMLGWKHLHVRRSIGKGSRWVTATNVTGWVDLTLWHERQQRVLFAELKTDVGKLSKEQVEVIESLSAAGQEVFVWRPKDLEYVAAVLSGKETAK